jgi:hypothetical protein
VAAIAASRDRLAIDAAADIAASRAAREAAKKMRELAQACCPSRRSARSLALPLLQVQIMGQPKERRCAIWMDTATFTEAQELAELTGVDVDSFMTFVVKELHEREAREGALRGPAQGAAPVIPIDRERRRRRHRPG